MNEEKISIEEFAIIIRLPVEEIINYVCHCDLSVGFFCDYHKNNKVKKTFEEWESLACDCEYGYVCDFHKSKNAVMTLSK